jgi:hypothetical protein
MANTTTRSRSIDASCYPKSLDRTCREMDRLDQEARVPGELLRRCPRRSGNPPTAKPQSKRKATRSLGYFSSVMRYASVGIKLRNLP